MSKAGVKHSEVKKLLMKDEAFKEEYEKLKLRDELLAVEQERGALNRNRTDDLILIISRLNYSTVSLS